MARIRDIAKLKSDHERRDGDGCGESERQAPAAPSRDQLCPESFSPVPLSIFCADDEGASSSAADDSSDSGDDSFDDEIKRPAPSAPSRDQPCLDRFTPVPLSPMIVDELAKTTRLADLQEEECRPAGPKTPIRVEQVNGAKPPRRRFQRRAVVQGTVGGPPTGPAAGGAPPSKPRTSTSAPSAPLGRPPSCIPLGSPGSPDFQMSEKAFIAPCNRSKGLSSSNTAMSLEDLPQRKSIDVSEKKRGHPSPEIVLDLFETQTGATAFSRCADLNHPEQFQVCLNHSPGVQT